MGEERFMREAIRIANASCTHGGGPFGAVIVKNGKIIASGVNLVVKCNDPIAHAEICAIREACQSLRTINLKGCDIYTSCEPCPMCLSAIYWSGISHIYYGNTRKDAADIGFADNHIYNEINRPVDQRTIPMTPMLHDEALHTFHLWEEQPNKKMY